MSTSLVLYELVGRDEAVRFSPHCWKVRLALAHKGLSARFAPVRYTAKEAIAFTGQGKVPVLVDDGITVIDSMAIAEHLEWRHPQAPPLFGDSDGLSLARFVNHWVDNTLFLPLARMILADIHAALAPEDQQHFRRTRERWFGQPLEVVSTAREAELPAWRALLEPARRILDDTAYLGGAEPRYPDHCLFSLFMMSQSVSAFELLADDDPIASWRNRMLQAPGAHEAAITGA